MSEIQIKVREALRRYCGSEWIEKTVEDILTIFEHYKEATPAVASEAAKRSDVRAACEVAAEELWMPSSQQMPPEWPSVIERHLAPVVEARVQAAAVEMRERCAKTCNDLIRKAPTDEAAVAFALAAETVRQTSILTNAYDAMLRAATASLNRTITEMVEYRWKLRQSTEALLKYAEEVYPYPSRSGDDRAAEESRRRISIITNAKEILYNTALTQPAPERKGEVMAENKKRKFIFRWKNIDGHTVEVLPSRGDTPEEVWAWAAVALRGATETPRQTYQNIHRNGEVVEISNA